MPAKNSAADASSGTPANTQRGGRPPEFGDAEEASSSAPATVTAAAISPRARSRRPPLGTRFLSGEVLPYSVLP